MSQKINKDRFAVILSGGSRRGRQVAFEVCKVLGDQAEFIVVAKTRQEQIDTIRDGLKKGIRNFWIGGGDGSVRVAASELVETGAVLTILPLGTGNSLARELGIPVQLEKAIEFHQKYAVHRAIDVGYFGEECFVNVATLGLTTKIMEEVKASNKGLFGRIVYVPAIARAFSLTRPFHLEVETEAGNFQGRALQLVAASTRLHGGGPFPVSEKALIDDGKLSIYVVAEKGKGNLIRYGIALLLGHQTDLPEVWNVEVESAKVRLTRRRKFVVDGDPQVAKTVEITIKKQGLIVSALAKEDC